MRVLRAASTFARPAPILAPMPIARPAPAQPAASPLDVARERAELSRALAVRWPRAARDVLVIAARADRFNRRAVALGLPPLAAAVPLAAAEALWVAMGAEPAVQPGPGTRAGRPRAR